jgi:hypothetical protein
MIEGFKVFEITNYIQIDPNDLCDFDQIINSDDSLILIKNYTSEELLKKNWKEQMYFVGGYIQSKFNMLNLPKACLWNTYIIYLVNFNISMDLRIEIETDKFCCKKYLVHVSDKANESADIIMKLPALTSLCIGSYVSNVINDELTIKKLFVNADNINKNIKDYFLAQREFNAKSINIVVDEMMGVLDE